MCRIWRWMVTLRHCDSIETGCTTSIDYSWNHQENSRRSVACLDSVTAAKLDQALVISHYLSDTSEKGKLNFDLFKQTCPIVCKKWEGNSDKCDPECRKSADCDDGGLCNMDYGVDGGFCETCPGITEQHCVNASFITDLGTTECQSVCVSGFFANAVSVSLILICTIFGLSKN